MDSSNARGVGALSLATAALLLSPLVALGGAGWDGHAVVTHIFEMADQDGSGTLSPSEYDAARLERYGVSFTDCDANGNGETTLEEYLDLYDRHHGFEEESI